MCLHACAETETSILPCDVDFKSSLQFANESYFIFITIFMIYLTRTHCSSLQFVRLHIGSVEIVLCSTELQEDLSQLETSCASPDKFRLCIPHSTPKEDKDTKVMFST